MRKPIGFIALFFLATSCGILKSGKKMNPRDGVTFYAKEYMGTPYQLGGNNHDGIDCSGLIHNAFKKQGIRVSRTVDLLRKEGKRISKDRAKAGDLLFFKTTKKRKLTHAGIVVGRKGGEPLFIHASSSRGVIISSLREGYWNKAYAQTRRLIR
jgi:cell wall-associated NlpC family hydrolase